MNAEAKEDVKSRKNTLINVQPNAVSAFLVSCSVRLEVSKDSHTVCRLNI